MACINARFPELYLQFIFAICETSSLPLSTSVKLGIARNRYKPLLFRHFHEQNRMQRQKNHPQAEFNATVN